jgi:putative hydrolase of HD superfamily
MIFILLLICRKQIEGKDFNRTAIISYLITRIIKKSYTWDNKPENKEMFREAVENYDKFEMIYAKDETVSEVGLYFPAMIHSFADEINQEEEELFKAAKAIADYVEFKQIKKFIFKEERRSTEKEIKKRLKRTLKNSGAKKYVTRDFLSLLERISWGRNTIRWQGDAYVVDCSILAHMLETAIFGWLMALEKNKLELAEDAFLVGLFHDLPEIWTDDIPSPCKDRIRLASGKILRPLTEELERKALEKYFYPKLHPKVAEYCRMHIIFEELNDPEFHTLIKKADYFSADYELWWNICCGSKDIKFLTVLQTSFMLGRTKATTKVLEYMLEELKGVKFLKP